MHIQDIEIINSFNITGRGTALTTNLLFSFAEAEKFKSGDTIKYLDKIYEIISVESMYHGMNGKEDGLIESIAFITKEIGNKELFMKLVTPGVSNTMERMRWRKRNRWWIRPLQKIQIRYYLLIDKLKIKK